MKHVYHLEPEDEPFGRVVHQAVGMITEQATCDVLEAFARLTIRARATGSSVHLLALDVVDGIVRF